jgi:16S rRNA (guanine966-N2)-methyltransferase
VLVERDRKMAAVARRNLDDLLGPGGDRAELRSGDALKYIATAGIEPFNIVFLDPPYAQAPKLAAQLAAALPAVLAPGAIVITESDRRTPLELPEIALSRRSDHRYGDTLIAIYDAP